MSEDTPDRWFLIRIDRIPICIHLAILCTVVEGHTRPEHIRERKSSASGKRRGSAHF